MTAPNPCDAVTAMSMRRTHSRGIRLGVLVAFLAVCSSPVLAQVSSDDMPENASANRDGSGWACDRGYQKANGVCNAVKVPANAYSTDMSYGRGWRCTWGYRESGESCLAVKPPVNAHLSSPHSDTWKCDRGFRTSGDKCVVINTPPNGYLSNASFGTGWECEVGYRANAGNWAAVKVPANGYLNDASYRPDWNCNRGYSATDTACIALQVPENTHLDYSGNNWKYNHPYLKRAGDCALQRSGVPGLCAAARMLTTCRPRLGLSS